MLSAHLVLLVLAVICFLLAAVEANVPRVNLLAAGLLFIALSQLIA